MEVQSDFYNDFIQLTLNNINDLKKQGFKFEEFDEWKKRKGESVIKLLSGINKEKIIDKKLVEIYNKDLIYYFANLMEKIPDQVSRVILKCNDFVCPEKYKNELKFLEERIKNGDDLFSFLSRQIFNPYYCDGMLFDFGVTHFHLGMKQSKNQFLVEGSKEILYAFLDEKYCYFIEISEHGKWNDEGLLEKLDNDFPNVLKKWLLKDVVPIRNFNGEEKKRLRDKHVNKIITINGKSYMSPGWGMNVTGISTHSMFRTDWYIKYLASLETEIKKTINEELENIQDDIKIKIERIELNIIELDPIVVYDRINKLIIDIEYDEKRLSMTIKRNV